MKFWKKLNLISQKDKIARWISGLTLLFAHQSSIIVTSILLFVSLAMTDQNTPVPVNPEHTSSTSKTPLEMFQDIKDSFTDSTKSVLGDGTIDNLKHTATQVTETVWQVTNVVGGQMENLSQKMWGEEFAWEVKDIVNPVVSILTDVLKIAFFINPQKRISRGQYIIGSLAVIVIVGLFVSIFGAIVGPIGVGMGSILIMIPLINLAVKRFHDLNKSGRWALSILLPLVGWIMPTLFKGVNEKNTYGPDPLTTQSSDLTTYLITGLSLLILSTIVVTILGFLWIRVSEPQVDITNPDAIGEQIWWNTTNNFQQKATNTVNSTTQQIR